METQNEIINTALKTAKLGGYDGAHHKMFAIDQMVRVLTGCPEVEGRAIDCRGKPYTYTKLGESPEYIQWIKDYCAGEDGLLWDEGVAP